MKGLLLKDLLFLKKQKNFLFIIFLIGIMFSINNGNAVNGISYIIFAASFSIISTFSYDEADNCMMHLMTLPTGRKSYVNAKYTLGFAIPLIFSFILMVAGIVFELFRHSDVAVIYELIFSTVLMPLVAWIMYSIYFPIQLRFGSEKVRVVIFIIVGGVIGSSFVLSKLGFLDKISETLDSLSRLNEWMIICIFFVLSHVTTLISYLLSQKIMREKEF